MWGVRLCSRRRQGGVVVERASHLERTYIALWKTANILLAALRTDHLHLKNRLFWYQEPTDIQWLPSDFPRGTSQSPGYFKTILDLWGKSGQLSKSLVGHERINLFRVYLGTCGPSLTSSVYFWLKTY